LAEAQEKLERRRAKLQAARQQHAAALEQSAAAPHIPGASEPTDSV
jgi:hypothetical protein